MTTQRRLKILEALFTRRVDSHVATILPQFTQRFDADQLRAVAALLKRVAGSEHDAQRAAAGAQLLAAWRAEVTAAQWRSLWMLDSVLESVNAALAIPSPY